MRASAVVCTRNRSDLIGDCLDALSRNDFRDMEILIIDQSTDPRTAGVVSRKSANDSRIRHIHSESVGLSRARNIGIRESNGDVIAFTDDDCIPSPEWVRSIWETFADMPDVSAMYGRSLPYETVRPGERAVAVKYDKQPRIFRGVQNPWALGHGCNMAFRREVFGTVGMFDEALGPGGDYRNCDDADFTYRMLRAGLTAFYNPEALVHHRQFRHGADLWKLERDYGIGAGAFLSKHLKCHDPYVFKLICDRVGKAGVMHLIYGLLTCRRLHLRLGWYRIAYSILGMWLARKHEVARGRQLFITGG